MWRYDIAAPHHQILISMNQLIGPRYHHNDILSSSSFGCLKNFQARTRLMKVFGRYKVTQPIWTISRDDQNRVIYHFSVAVIEGQAGHVARQFRSSDLDGVRAAFCAVDEMLAWLRDAAD